MELLEALEIGDAVKADCKVEEIDSFYTVLKRTEMRTVNVEAVSYTHLGAAGGVLEIGDDVDHLHPLGGGQDLLQLLHDHAAVIGGHFHKLGLAGLESVHSCLLYTSIGQKGKKDCAI